MNKCERDRERSANACVDPTRYDFARQAYIEALNFPQSSIAPEAALRLV